VSFEMSSRSQISPAPAAPSKRSFLVYALAAPSKSVAFIWPALALANFSTIVSPALQEPQRDEVSGGFAGLEAPSPRPIP
jgi:hypothetical protein